MVVAALVVGALILGFVLWPARPPAGVLVEVTGDVPRPGWHRIASPTLRDALAAADAPLDLGATTPLREGDRVVVGAAGIRLEPAGDPLLVALPVDVNLAEPRTLATVPGIGDELARAIVEDREARGPFYTLDELARVRGIGPGAVAAYAPLVTVGDVGPRPPPAPVDLNTADAEALTALPGIGPVMAARIVADRERRGRFRSVEDLDRVRGIGPYLVGRVRGRAVVDGR